jgi:MoaA/NifB/PqqE/SkfB family radical SAM enzyme
MINSLGKEGEENYGTVFKKNGKALTTADDISKNRNAPAWKKIRKEMLNGERPELCKLCWDEEDNGIGSRREWTNNVFNNIFEKAILKTTEDGAIKHSDFPIEHWDLRFGNKCNLACRSCGPTDSDLWYKDWVAMKGENTFYNRGIGEVTIHIDEKGKASVKDSPFEWFNKTDLVDTVKESMPNIKRFYFTGGEPTINHTHRQLLQYAIDNGFAKNITLDYNTNMAGVPLAIFKQWKEFKEVNLGMSIDGIYEHFEYIRHPGKWSAAYKNLCRVDKEDGLENVRASITMTVSIMNVLHLLDMQWWMREQKWNRIESSIIVHNLYGPKHLNIQNLPPEMKKYVTDRYYKFLKDIQEISLWPNDPSWYHIVSQRLLGILQHMNDAKDDPAEWKNFLSETQKLDKIRNEDWRESLPEIAQMIQICSAQEMRKRDVKLATASKK